MLLRTSTREASVQDPHREFRFKLKNPLWHKPSQLDTVGPETERLKPNAEEKIAHTLWVSFCREVLDLGH